MTVCGAVLQFGRSSLLRHTHPFRFTRNIGIKFAVVVVIFWIRRGEIIFCNIFVFFFLHSVELSIELSPLAFTHIQGSQVFVVRCASCVCFAEKRQNEKLFNGDAIVVDCSHVSKTVGVTLFMVRARLFSPSRSLSPLAQNLCSVNTRSGKLNWKKRTSKSNQKTKE